MFKNGFIHQWFGRMRFRDSEADTRPTVAMPGRMFIALGFPEILQNIVYIKDAKMTSRITANTFASFQRCSFRLVRVRNCANGIRLSGWRLLRIPSGTGEHSDKIWMQVVFRIFDAVSGSILQVPFCTDVWSPLRANWRT